ncbi:IS4 family transposase [Streptomyces sp. 4.24]|uniref:IS4 family transposase n=1 Tax=Streptomyces tritrimontium TaxID=3406573 RepID=UPI003BB62633
MVPVELVDAVLEETRTRERRLRDLPSRVGVYFVLALGLFEHLGAGLVWQKLVAGLEETAPRPSEKALRDLRRRIGARPLEQLFAVLAGPLGQPSTPGVCYRRWRTVAFDGCSSLSAPDHERNRSWLGRFTSRFGTNSYPRVMLMALCETGTRGLIGAVFGPAAEGELAYAKRLVGHLAPDMLLLADRGFDSNGLLAEVAGRGTQFLVRSKSSRRPPVLVMLPDHSYLSRIGSLAVRVIEADILVRGTDGSRTTGTYRLLTTLTDHRTDPATTLVRLYHERWEIECAFLALRHTLLKGRVLRSKDPAGITQELWGLLALYQALRSVMVTAAETQGLDPDRAGFTIALEAARDTVIRVSGLSPEPGPDGRPDLAGHIGAAVLLQPLPARRPRISARIVKRGISRYHTWNHDGRPLDSTPIAAIDITVRPPALPTDTAPSRPRAPDRQDRWTQVSQVMAADVHRTWQAKEIAHALGVTGQKSVNSLSTQLGYWARGGRLVRTAPSTYKITIPTTLTTTTSP